MTRCRKMTDLEVDEVADYYRHGIKLRVIAVAVDRPLGTVCTLTGRLRESGLIGERYNMHVAREEKR